MIDAMMCVLSWIGYFEGEGTALKSWVKILYSERRGREIIHSFIHFCINVAGLICIQADPVVHPLLLEQTGEAHSGAGCRVLHLAWNYPRRATAENQSHSFILESVDDPLHWERLVQVAPWGLGSYGSWESVVVKAPSFLSVPSCPISHQLWTTCG